MAYIPADAVWYLADIVEEIRVEGAADSIVHINCLLIRADSPEEAYDKALELGKEAEDQYENTDDKQVAVVFRGLRNLLVIYDELEHGAEISYQEIVGLSEEGIHTLVTPKAELGVFEPRKPSTGPNYMPKSVMEKLKQAGFDERDLYE
jgi:effector-binding domain-containing protein